MTNTHRSLIIFIFLLHHLMLVVSYTHIRHPRPILHNGIQRVEILGEKLKQQVHALRRTSNGQVELVFLVDESTSVGEEKFQHELKFVKKLLADFTVDQYTTRVAVITYSSPKRVFRRIDHLSVPTNGSYEYHKCSLMEEELPRIGYHGGSTNTKGALLEAQAVLRAARTTAQKVVFLMTDGHSNSGDPIPAAEELKRDGVQIYTIGIIQGNTDELTSIASEPKDTHCYILDNFDEFEALARRALHEDLQRGNFMLQIPEKCNKLCDGDECCSRMAVCRCGTHTGKYECACRPGYYGNGLRNGCQPCPAGTYKNVTGPGDVNTCIKCPDPNHESHNGSTSIKDCTCKKSFKDDGHHRCAEMTCPALEAPRHGYFVRGKCNNVVNAACGTRCMVGYKLQGSSLRLCQPDGTWSGQPVTCEVKSCQKLEAPRNGKITCIHPHGEFSFESTCEFHCNPGYFLVGSEKRKCLAISYWNNLPSSCREITCKALPELSHGKIKPGHCTDRDMPYNSHCNMVCDPGYKLNVHDTKVCGNDGDWGPVEFVEPRCIDVTPPEITCPGDIEAVAEPDDNTAKVMWYLPSMRDNSGELPTLTVIPAMIPPVMLPISRTLITYVAEDMTGNKANCTFTVTVIDDQPPKVEKCNSPGVFVLVNEGELNVTWEEPVFWDNSRQRMTVRASHRRHQHFPVGLTKVTYTASDLSGNNNTCVINIQVKEHLCANPPGIENGNVTCDKGHGQMECSIACKPGYGFAMDPADVYTCNYHTGLWLPDSKFPDCSLSRLSNHVIQNTRIMLKTHHPCDDELLLDRMSERIFNRIEIKVSELCDRNAICSVQNFRTECLDKDATINQAFDELSNVIRADLEENVLGRVRRSVKTNDDIYHVGVEFQIYGKIQYLSSYIPLLELMNMTGDSQQHLVSSVRNVMDELRTGQLDLNTGDMQDLGLQALEFKSDDPQFACLQGSIKKGSECVDCPSGTFFNVQSNQCEGCPIGTYQKEEGQLTCQVCPNNTSTASNHSKSIVECKSQCLPGTFSQDGLELCEACPVGQYQLEYASVTCDSCPLNKTTLRPGSRTDDDCLETCEQGYISKTGVVPCYPCPRGNFQHQRGRTSCYVCPGEAVTVGKASTHISQCIGTENSDMSVFLGSQPTELSINDCFAEPCENNATCSSLPVGYTCICQGGWTGLHCETEIDECRDKPCKHNATCVDRMDDYLCLCPDGYTGKNCSIDIDECQSSPCRHNATCKDLVDGFDCQCPPGFNGTLCERNIDECEQADCENNATCVDGIASYECQCMAGFTGTKCEVDINECHSNPCLNKASCVDLPNSFRCDCKAGYTGSVCETDINECLSSPCHGLATCHDEVNGYVCYCPASYNGTHCESKMSSDFHLEFPTARVTDYGMLQPPGRNINMTSLTVTFWMNTTDKNNYGTVLSYANRHTSNAITIGDYSGFVVKINDKHFVTDVTANDGRWHQIAITWKSPDGHWVIYKDGILQQKGYGVAQGTTVEGGGVYVIGQEQDEAEGYFNVAESFIGTMSALHIWDRALTADEIQEAFWRSDVTGNLIAWSDFRSSVRGLVNILPSNFYQGCPAPGSAVENGRVVHNTPIGQRLNLKSQLTYQCNKGYKLEGDNTRICMPYSDWSGDQPHCKIVKCGFPTNIPHASKVIHLYIFTYLTPITYKCDDGYRMVGNATQVCLEDGQWHGNPTCVEILCPEPSLSSHVYLVKNNRGPYRPRQSLEYGCPHGFRLIGENVTRCGKDGTWSADPPRCEKVLCRDPPNIEHGTPQTNGRKVFTLGDTVSYICHVGFYLRAFDRYNTECQEDSRWSYPRPSCDYITCQPPQYLLHGQVDMKQSSAVKRYAYGTLALYTCDKGYRLLGNAALVCYTNGLWNSSAPICAPVECPLLIDVLNGVVNSTRRTYAVTVGYTCDAGFRLVGNAARTCQSDGSWSGIVPSCSPIHCPPAPDIAYGIITGSNYTYDAVVSYSCVKGYLLRGQSTRRCLEDGQWERPIPLCSPVECSTPVPIAHGRVISDNIFEYKSVLEYACDSGFHLVGTKTRVCQWNGTWSETQPHCEEVSCPAPERVQHGQVDKNQAEYAVGSVVTFTCEYGYRLDGKASRTCRGDGTWTGHTPSCVENQCDHPEHIKNGILSTEGMTVGSTVRYVCNEGYQLDGPAVRTCSNDRHWSGTEPSCDAIVCGKPEPISQGNFTIEGIDFTLGTHVRYSCNKGYKVQGSERRECLSNGTWSGEEPACVPVDCPAPDLVTNGTIIGKNYTFGGIVQYVCHEGYNIIGESSQTCKDTGEWDVSAPKCEKVECEKPSYIRHCLISGDDYHYQSKVTYDCNDGFELIGPSSRECQSDGTWSGDEPKCVPYVCPQPQGIADGDVQLKGIFFKGQVEYSCDPGYKLVGQAIRNCTKKKQWDGDDPICVRIKCGAPPDIHQGKATQREVEFGDKVVYECQEGYVLDRPSDISCSATGSYTGDTPQCVRVRCVDPDKVDNGYVITGNNTSGEYGTYIYYKCRPGFKLIGVTERQCGQDGQWTDETPKCEVAHCLPEPGSIENGHTVGPVNNTFGSRVTYVCDDGYQLQGSRTLTCLEDSTWSAAFPHCVSKHCNKLNVPNLFVAEASGHSSIERYVSNITKFVPGLTIKVNCEAGYILNGTAELKCADNGQWSTDLPICDPIRCPMPKVDNAIIKGSNKYRERIFVKCSPGFKPDGETELHCLKDGTWSRRIPTCSLVSCEGPYIENGNMSVLKSPNKGTGYPYGMTLKFNCYPGFNRVGVDVLVCSDGGKWSSDVPQCIPNYCTTPLDDSYHHLVATTKKAQYRFDERIHFRCESQYELVGDDSIKCLPNGNWQGKVPTCELKLCEPPVLPNGNYFTPYTHNPDRIFIGSELTFTCESGYRLIGEKTSSCQPNKKWSNPTPKCESLTCDVPNIANSILTTKLPSPSGSILEVTCEEGYEVIGQKTLTCGSQGVWEGFLPKCFKVRCMQFELKNGHTSNEKSSYEFGESVKVTCDEGYILDGPSEVNCAADRTWLPRVPTCLSASCVRPVVHHGSVANDTVFTFGSSVKVYCDKGYMKSGPAESQCLANSTWSTLAQCLPVTCPQLTITDAVLSTESTVYDTKVEINCTTGFYLIGSADLRCTSGGKWSEPLPLCIRVECPTPLLQNGTIKHFKQDESAPFTFGDSVRFICNEGYELIGEPEMVCQPDETWSGKFPYCHIKSCGPAPVVANAPVITSETNFTYGHTITVECELGYAAEGDSYLRCGPEGKWLGSVECKGVFCTPENIANGFFTIEAPYIFGAVASYSCNDGYSLVGTPNRMCMPDGSWSEEQPKCERTACAIPILENGYVIASPDHANTTFYVNEVMYYRCNHGYVIDGETESVCLKDGTWDAVHATCVKVQCPDLAITNAIVRGVSRSYGDTAAVLCQLGYELAGSSSIECQADGTWSDVPFCRQVRCPLPPDIENGEYMAHSFTFGSKVIYSCWKGYELVGERIHECLANKTWGGGSPSCGVIECHKPEAPVNGTVSTTTFTYKSVAQFYCNTGFKIVGARETRCEANGQWRYRTPQCVYITCTDPESIENTRVSGSGRSFGDAIHYKCVEGYELQTEVEQVCTEQGWRGDPPVCLPVMCPPLDNPDHGYLLKEGLMYKSSVQYLCDAGYQLSGPAKLYCQANKTWSDVPPECVKVTCPQPDIPANGHVKSLDITYKSVIEYTCDKGFDLKGDKIRSCQADGTWSGHEAVCHKKTCPKPDRIAHGYYKGAEVTFGSQIDYICENKYELVGAGRRVCEADGVWSGDEPMCQLVQCPPPRLNDHTLMLGDDTAVGSTVTFQCDQGYQLVGDSKLVCTDGKNWNGEFPRCDKVSCGLPKLIENGQLDGNSYQFKDIVKFKCLNGFEIKGNPEIRCQANATWTPIQAECVPVSCGPPPTITHGNYNGNSYRFGDFIYYHCNEGYDLDGNNLLQCGEDGKWNGTIPHCSRVTCGHAPVIQHASTIVRKTTTGIRVSYHCNRGYVLHGNPVVECMADKHWKFISKPQCIPVNCGDPPLVLFGKVVFPDTTLHNIAKYQCDDGFTPSPKSNLVLQCGAEARWNGSAPLCQRNQCHQPTRPDRGGYNGEDFSFGAIVTFWCDEGYAVRGAVNATCQADGTWDNGPPHCKAVYCPVLTVAEGHTNSSVHHFGAFVEILCKTNFVVEGDNVLKCQDTGLWDKPVPRCVSKRQGCSVPSLPAFALQPKVKLYTGDILEIQCQEGYVPTGNMTIQCLSGGSWTSASGYCSKTACGPPDLNNLVVLMNKGYNIGDQLLYMCRAGMSPQRPTLSTCRPDGNWFPPTTCTSTCFKPCENGGECIGFNKCKCQSGYSGMFCEKAHCILQCFNGGTCVGPYQCQCLPGYTGLRCQKPVCDKPCAHGGMCFRPNRCRCPHGYSPPYCEDFQNGGR